MNSLHSRANEQFNTEYYQLASWDDASNILYRILDGSITGYGLSNVLQNDSDYVTRLMYFPFLLTKFCTGTPTTTNTFFIGSARPNVSPQELANSLKYEEWIKWFEVSASTHNNFYEYEPYTKYKLYVPFFDTIEIPCKNVYDGFSGYITLDISSGRATLSIVSSGVTIITTSAQVGIPLSLGATNKQEQQRNNILQGISLVGSAVGIVGGIATQNPLVVAGAVGIGAKAIATAMANNVDRLTMKGGSGSRDSLGCDRGIYLISETVKNVVRPDLSIKGRPCKQNKVLSTLSGYTEIGEIHFNPSDNVIYDDEISEIIDLLHTGVIL